MYRRCSVLTLAVAAWLVWSNTGRAADPAGQGNPPAATATVISGRVTDAQGQPVAGAQVTLYQMTYAAGAFTPDPVAVGEKSTGPDGTFTLTPGPAADAQKPAFVVARKEGLSLGWAFARGQGEQRVEIALEEAKDLAGDVVDEKGGPVAGAEVRIAAIVLVKGAERRRVADPLFLRVQTDARGHFVLPAMPADATVEFQVEKPGRPTISTLQRTRYAGDRFQFAPGQAGIKLVLPRETRIEGVVVEATSGKPVAGVSVIALSNSRQNMLLSPRPVTTAEDGTFRLSGLTAGTYMVQLSTFRERLAEWVAEPMPVTVGADETKSGLKLELSKGGILEVLVKDDHGKSVSKANVSVRRPDGDQYFNAVTDANGLARIRVSPGVYVITDVYHNSYRRQMNLRLADQEQVRVEAGATQRIERVLTAMPKLTGTVRDEAGTPLAGVRIGVYPMSRSEAMSDASGRFEATWDPTFLGSQPDVSILVAQDMARNLAGSADIDEQTTHLDLKLGLGVTITGTVLNEQGKPLPGARIRLMLHGGRWRTTLGARDSIVTGPDGTFEIKTLLPDRQYTLTALADGYGQQDVSLDTAGAKENRCTAGTFKLALANLSITGIVVDPNDQPVPGASIFVSSDTGPLDRRDVRTDAQGKFTIQNLAPGSLRLSVNVPGSTRLFGSARVESGATDVRIVVSEQRSVQPYVPRRAPSLKGKPLPALKDLGLDPPAQAEGRMVLICFWDMGQRPSRNCLTQLAAQAAELGAKGVTVVAVHTAKVEDGTPREWVEKNRIPFRTGNIAGDPEKTQFAWGVTSLPHLILTDRKHVVVAEGFSPSDLDKQIESAAGR